MARTHDILPRVLLTGDPKTRAESKSNQWAGRTTLNSGSATVTVSTSVVKSDSIIMTTIERNTRQSSGVSTGIEVTSITDGSWFSLATADGSADAIPVGSTIMWLIVNTSDR